MAQDYSKMTKEALVGELKRLRPKKYGLVWEDKEEDVVKECKTKLPVLNEVTKRAIKKAHGDPTNVIIEGDNYHALSVLNYTHQGKIDVIYIDPPYNTGSSHWIYNNKIIDANDTYRHSKWLTFMESRLTAAKKLLSEHGVIIVAIDDYELYTLGLLLDSIFGESNKIGAVTVENNPRGRTGSQFFAISHEYHLIYAKNINRASFYNLPLTEDQKDEFNLIDDVSAYKLKPLRKSGAASRFEDRKKQFFPIYVNPVSLSGSLERETKNDVEILPIDNSNTKRVWCIGKEKCGIYLRNGEIVIKKDKLGKIGLFVKDRIRDGRKPRSVWVGAKYDTSSYGANLLLKMFGKRVFDYPKSLYEVRDFIYVLGAAKKDSVILDFFAGSGTTGHAVMDLNNEDGGKRQFILCTNNENKIAEEVTYPRIKKVIEGYADVSGIPANVRYFRTDFVNKTASRDEQKIRLTERCTEMLCLREGIYAETIVKRSYKIFQENGRVLAVYYAVSHKDLPNLKKELDKLKGDKVLYCFTLDSGELDARDFAAWKDVRLEPIPQKILDIYKEIHEY